MTFTATESEGSRIITDECYAFAWITRLRTKITSFDSIDVLAGFPQNQDIFIIEKIDGFIEALNP